jgi:hypothetical protein
MIVDFAVVRYLQPSVFISHRLVTGCDVYNAKSTVSQTDSTINKHTTVVRTAMFDHIAHPFENIPIDFTSRFG